MTSPNDYRDFARWCIEKAERSKDPKLKAAMNEMAKNWIAAALEVERSLALRDDAPHVTIVPKGR